MTIVNITFHPTDPGPLKCYFVPLAQGKGLRDLALETVAQLGRVNADGGFATAQGAPEIQRLMFQTARLAAELAGTFHEEQSVAISTPDSAPGDQPA